MNWYKSRSTVRPSQTDTTSSKVYNYIRQNIKEVIEIEDDEEVTMFEYDEAKIPKESWNLYLKTTQNSADIEYLAMETGIELEV